MRRTGPQTLALATMPLAIAACSVTGLGGSASYSCQAPEGVTCNSVSGVYANAIGNNLPGRQSRATAPAPTHLASAASAAWSASATDAPLRPDELRSAPRVLRLWFKPWEDADHDLFDQGYVYVQIDAGQWRVDHVQRRIRDGFAAIKPPARSASATEPEPRSGPRSPPDAREPRQIPRPLAPAGGND